MKATVRFPVQSQRVPVFGAGERNLKLLRESLGVHITSRDGVVHLTGDDRGVAIAQRVLQRLEAAAAGPGSGLSRDEVQSVIADETDIFDRTGEGEDDVGSLGWEGRLDVYAGGRAVRPKSPNQEAYLRAIRENDMVFGVGPAGTGKTYLAVAAAVHLLKAGRVRRVILTRPAVEAGEKLGFLPGTLEAKVNPYLRPLLDALSDMMDYHTVRRFMESDVVEVVPLAFMRGRTLNNAAVILDEAQNTTRGQMKMFLTRMGNGSKMIVTGDITQSDLPDTRESGLIDASRRLRRAPGIAWVTFERADVVRHPLVQRVIDAYGEDDAAPAPETGSPPA